MITLDKYIKTECFLQEVHSFTYIHSLIDKLLTLKKIAKHEIILGSRPMDYLQQMR